MYEYTPEYSPEITIEYEVISFGQEETFHQPGHPPEIEITAVKINDKGIGEYLETHLIDTHGKHWEKEIINNSGREVA